MSGARPVLVDGGVWLPAGVCGKYRLAMSVVLRQAAARRPGGVVPADIAAAQAVLALAAADAVDGTNSPRQGADPSGSRRVITVHEAAELLGAAPRTVRAWIAAGKLPAVQVGRVWLLSRVEVEAFRTGREIA